MRSVRKAIELRRIVLKSRMFCQTPRMFPDMLQNSDFGAVQKFVDPVDSKFEKNTFGSHISLRSASIQRRCGPHNSIQPRD